MERTEEKIKDVMNLFKNWGLLEKLSPNEVKTIESDLRGIAGTALIEANNKMQNMLPNMYKKITQEV